MHHTPQYSYFFFSPSVFLFCVLLSLLLFYFSSERNPFKVLFISLPLPLGSEHTTLFICFYPNIISPSSSKRISPGDCGWSTSCIWSYFSCLFFCHFLIKDHLRIFVSQWSISDNDYAEDDLQFPAWLSVPGCCHYCKHDPEGLRAPCLVPCVLETMGKELSLILGTCHARTPLSSPQKTLL